MWDMFGLAGNETRDCFKQKTIQGINRDTKIQYDILVKFGEHNVCKNI